MFNYVAAKILCYNKVEIATEKTAKVVQFSPLKEQRTFSVKQGSQEILSKQSYGPKGVEMFNQ